MKALILAAGLGSRLEDKTSKCPKALIKVKGRPILYYQLSNLLQVGIRDIIIVVGYKGEMIKEYVSNNFLRANIIYIENDLYSKSNSSFSFWKAKNHVMGGPYIHLNCDILFSQSLLLSIIQSNYSNVFAVRKDLLLDNGMENVTLRVDKIIHMSLNKTPDSICKAFGLAKFSKKSTELVIKTLQSYLDKGDKNQNYYGIIRQTLKTIDYRVCITNKNNLQEINTISDLERVKKFSNKSMLFITRGLEKKKWHLE